MLRHPAAVTWIYCVAWGPDGRRLATGCNDRQIHVWDSDTGSEVMPPWYCGDDGIHVSYNAAGDRLASTGYGKQTWLWDAASGRVLLKMPGGFGWRFSRDGRLLFATDRGVETAAQIEALRGQPALNQPVPTHTSSAA